jgi:hypothetical protein
MTFAPTHSIARRLRCRRRFFLALVAALLACGAADRTARAGGGPEGLFLVVNGRSWASVAVANQFIKLRQIPAVNVLYLDWPLSVETVDSEVFRQGILLPVLSAMQQRMVTDQIDCIVYSSDFPYAIDFKADLGGQQLPQGMIATGSITALTYFAPQLLSHDYNFAAPNANRYMRRPAPGTNEIPSQGFRGWYGFGPQGEVIEGGGQHYILSAMLAYTSGLGNSVPEALDYLNRAAAADGTKPKGTIYYMRTGDTHRSGTREVTNPNAQAMLRAVQIDPALIGFVASTAALKKEGVNAEVVNGIIPLARNDVQGVTTGTRNYDWKASKSTIKPGAIGDNLTSYGGIFAPNDQTPLSEFLRYGAAGASGTVVEPTADPRKFPLAFMHVHYARGCSLVESYYQSVYAPYQLLIVGDPLCRPWANIPQVTVDGIKPDETLKGKVTLTPHGSVAGGGTVDRFLLFVDGNRLGGCAAGETLELDSTNLLEGQHELRVVGTESSPIESQGRAIVSFVVANGEHKIEFTASPKDKVRWNETLTLRAQAPGAKAISFVEGARLLKSYEGERAELALPGQTFWSGTIGLRAIATFGDAPSEHVNSRSIDVTIEPNPPLPGRKLRAGASPPVPGLQLKPDGGATVVVPHTDKGEWLTRAGVKPDQTFKMVAIFEVPTDGVYQFQALHLGKLSIKVDGTSIYDGDDKQPQMRYAPVSLGRGLHALELNAGGNQPQGLEIRFGGPGTQYLDGKVFRHPG